MAGRSVPTALRYRGEVVGAVGARVDEWSGSADLGHWVDAAHEGRGLVTRAADALLRHLHTERGLPRVEIRTAVGDARSRAVAERLGSVLEGVLRSGHAGPDGREDLCLDGHLAEDPGRVPGPGSTPRRREDPPVASAP